MTGNSHLGKIILTAILMIFLFSVGTGSAAFAENGPFPGMEDITLKISNDVRFNNAGDNTYYLPISLGTEGMHISERYQKSASNPAVIIENRSGTFYVYETGGAGYIDDVVLMVGVAGNITDDFKIKITSGGYVWEPVSQSTFRSLDFGARGTYKTAAISEWFDKSDLLYGPVSLRPADAAGFTFYPTQSENETFYVMLVDLHVGTCTVPNGNLIHNGCAEIDYEIAGLTGQVTFIPYGYRDEPKNDPKQVLGWTAAETEGITVNVVDLPGPETTQSPLSVFPIIAGILGSVYFVVRKY
ncbi:MAG: hypothetical protein PHF01_00835 [Methanocorpusculum sp.]|jgi:hypothetical protein|uniref:hypothetical protein n=1 Tax=unclassified Methanocorpusculum TaxID=225464 RepID=UPI0014329BB8|nr:MULTISPECIES: hypothetical protein [unclassified Methanocorpusculum]MDD4423070.1 hypothetical protein [Methanocorpusculum parvum]MDD2802573.1 hypothetical protein [Methanocorpusculum sp.]MDD3046734.1 hypothetical protein [Methanocorpusculum sp.]MDD3912034.1 hypothetical protein [Methanocorpusculum sp.]MDY3201964.1 hypothetical protein [Methanocorpusculum sp.]